ncbi:Methyl-accepting chemotaxis protein, partial [Pseudomonas savastanoi]
MDLRNTLSHVGQAAGQLFTATEELNILMRDNNADLRVQNSEIEMSAAAVTEMSQAVQEVTRNAVSTSEESKASARAAQEGQGARTTRHPGHRSGIVAKEAPS